MSKPNKDPAAPASLADQLYLLWHVQAIDSKITHSFHERQARPGIIERLRTEIDSHQFALRGETSRLDDIERKLRQTAAELSRDQANLKRLTAQKKRAGKLAELELLKKNIFKLDMVSTALTTEKEQITEKLKAVKEELSHAMATLKHQEELTIDDATGLRDRSQTLSRQRGRHLSKLSSDILAYYDRIRKTRGGVGVVQMRGNHCSGCNMLLPAQISLEVKREKILIVCPSCQRMLCWRSTDDA